jgi:hypothetical protein
MYPHFIELHCSVQKGSNHFVPMSKKANSKFKRTSPIPCSTIPIQIHCICKNLRPKCNRPSMECLNAQRPWALRYKMGIMSM